MPTTKSRLTLHIILMIAGWFFVFQTPGQAQTRVQLTHQVSASVAVMGNNFVAAREQAVLQAFKAALEKALRNFVGDKQFETNKKDFRKVLAKADQYVQSYRFIDAEDDPIENRSDVIMLVTLFPDALGQSLSRIGGIKVPENAKNVVVLISEKSVTSNEEAGAFWETTPISEAALVQAFREAGVNVIPRSSIMNMVPEETVLEAVNGNVNNAVQIGLKVGVDIVILGNAVSKKIENQVESGESSVQTNISVRVISALNSDVIAAKSDFATARNKDLLTGELEAFGDVSRKLSSFLLSSITRYWDAPSASRDIKRTSPSPSPLPLEDL